MCRGPRNGVAGNMPREESRVNNRPSLSESALSRHVAALAARPTYLIGSLMVALGPIMPATRLTPRPHASAGRIVGLVCPCPERGGPAHP